MILSSTNYLLLRSSLKVLLLCHKAKILRVDTLVTLIMVRYCDLSKDEIDNNIFYIGEEITAVVENTYVCKYIHISSS